MLETVFYSLRLFVVGGERIAMAMVAHLYTKYHRIYHKFLMPEAFFCCLQTCKCGFDIRVVLYTSVPSLIVRNANTTKLKP